MQIVEAQQDGVRIVAPAGRIDSTTATAFERHLLACLAAGERRLVVDFSSVDYISSAGLRVMLLLARRVRDAKGALTLCGMGDAVRHIFDLAGFLPLFSVAPSRDAAVRQAAGP